MASLSGVSSSNGLSSLMNSANMISGLASGLDTESMIESLVKSYQTKINQLNQKITKVEWKQDAYRSIIAQMYSLSSKYTSYTSNTNLMSVSFFNSAVKVSALGKYADAVSASGKTSSSISLNAVHQLATAAQYRTSSNLISGKSNSIEASDGLDLEGKTTLGALSGNLTLTYGDQTVTVSFDQVADVETIDEIKSKLGADATDADVLAELINRKLSGQTLSLSGGNTADAADRIQVSVLEDGSIYFSDKSSAKNLVYISGASGNLGTTLGLDGPLEDAKTSKNYPKDFMAPEGLTQEVDNKAYLAGKTMNMSLDGVSRTIELPKIIQDEYDNYYIEDANGNQLEYNAENYTKVLSDAVESAFKGKVKVSNVATDGESLQLRFDVQEGSNLVINSSVGDTLGIGRVATSYLNTNKTLGELMGDRLNALQPALDKDGNERLDKDGNKLYTFEINGVEVGSYSKNSTLAELMDDINKSDAGVKVSYSQTTKNFLFESKETGVDGEIKLGGGLAEAMFGVDHANEKIGDLLGEDVLNRDFSFTIDGQKFSGTFLSDSSTMKDLVNKLNNEILNETDYKASYSPDRGLVITDSEGSDVEVKYGDDAFSEIVKASKPELTDRMKDKLVDILGEETIKGRTFSFKIGDDSYNGNILSDSGTMENMVSKLNNEIFTDGKYKASYSKETGLVIKDSSGKEVKVEYGDDVLGDIVEAVKVQDYSKDRLVDILDRETITPESRSFTFTVNAQTYTGEIRYNEATMNDLLNAMDEALASSGYTASYSSTTGELVIKDAQGKEANVEYGQDSTLGRIMDAYTDRFKGGNGSSYTRGQDAVFDVTVNGENIQMTRSSNSVNIDGMTITMKDTFNSKVDEDGNPVAGEDGKYQLENKLDSVTFKSSTDSDKIVDVIKSMIADYNAMMAEIKSTYMTMPYQKSSGSFVDYEPLTEEDMEGMSESAIERYEEKAKQGILFGDQTLSMLYTKLNQVFSFSNRADVDTLKEMGITVSYNVSDGAQAVTLDEDKLRAILDSDPDRVAELFTKTDGIMDRMKTQLDNYAKTTGEPKGILVQRAGTPLSSLSLLNNTWQSEIDNYTSQIEKWQDKLESQVERYTSQFTRLETLINQLNSQSSALASLMGGS